MLPPLLATRSWTGSRSSEAAALAHAPTCNDVCLSSQAGAVLQPAPAIRQRRHRSSLQLLLLLPLPILLLPLHRRISCGPGPSPQRGDAHAKGLQPADQLLGDGAKAYYQDALAVQGLPQGDAQPALLDAAGRQVGYAGDDASVTASFVAWSAQRRN